MWPLCWCAHKSHLSFDEFSLWQSKLYTNEHLLMIQSTVQNCSEKLAYCFKSSLQGLTLTSSSKASSSTWGFMRGPRSRSYYTVCLVCKAICSSFAYVYVQQRVFVVLLLQLEEEWVSGLLTIPLEWREAVCVCVCVWKRDLLVNCAVKSWGSLRERHLERACHSAAKSSARVHTENLQESWVSADTVWPSYYMFSITDSQVALLQRIFTCALSSRINFYASTTGHGDSQLSFLPFLPETFMIFPTFCTLFYKHLSVVSNTWL